MTELSPTAKVAPSWLIGAARPCDVFERRSVGRICGDETVVELEVCSEVAPTVVSEVRHPGAARRGNALCDVEVERLVGLEIGQVPLIGANAQGSRCVVSNAHCFGCRTDLGLGERRAALGEEAIPVSRRDDDGLPHEWLEEPIGHRLVDPERLEALSGVDRGLSCLVPLADCGCLIWARQRRAALHSALLGGPLEWIGGSGADPVDLPSHRDRSAARTVAAKGPVGVELCEDEPVKLHLKGGQTLAVFGDAVGDDASAWSKLLVHGLAFLWDRASAGRRRWVPRG